jgi:Flp pilus assembly pilin Flp
MRTLLFRIRHFLSSDDGPSAVEYAVLIGFLACAMVALVSSLAAQLTVTFSSANNAFTSS